MSSAGQPENNDLSRRRGFEARARHPAGGARFWPLIRAARRGRLGSPRTQRRVLAAIRSELQADADLAAAFSAFTSVTLRAAMPKTEQLPARGALARWRRCRRALLNRRVIPVVAAVVIPVALLALGLTVALTSSSPGGPQTRCDYVFARACPGASSAPAGGGGPLQAPDRPPVHAR
jgi:hypothetical protein